ncbi:MAG: helix-turn-helix domain-containing protein [Patescibacteria group bacterium]
MHIENILKNMGFSENEAKVYLASLEAGVSSAQDIAKKAKIKRTTAYSVLSDLMRKGFVHTTSERNKMRYIALAPKQLSERFAEYHKELLGAIPSLEAVYNKSQVKPKVVFFEGEEGIRQIYEDTIADKPQVILEYNTDNIFKFLPGFPNEYLRQRVHHNIRARRIAPKSPRWMFHRSRDKDELSETVMLPTDMYNPQIEINIYNNKVAFMSYLDAMGLIIESGPIADAMRQAYELSWFQARTIAKG